MANSTAGRHKHPSFVNPASWCAVRAPGSRTELEFLLEFPAPRVVDKRRSDGRGHQNLAQTAVVALHALWAEHQLITKPGGADSYCTVNLRTPKHKMPSILQLLAAGVVAVVGWAYLSKASQPRGQPAKVENDEEALDSLLREFEEYYKHSKQIPETKQESFTPLDKLNAKAASQIYSPLNRGEIRLIKLHPGTGGDPLICSVFPAQHSSTPSYIALSYVCTCHHGASLL